MCIPHLMPNPSRSTWHPSSAHVGIFPSSLLLLRRPASSDRTRSSAHPPISTAVVVMVVHHPRRRRSQAMSPFEDVLWRRRPGWWLVPVSESVSAAAGMGLKRMTTSSASASWTDVLPTITCRCYESATTATVTTAAASSRIRALRRTQHLHVLIHRSTRMQTRTR